MIVLGVDPGPKLTSYVVFGSELGSGCVRRFRTVSNEAFLAEMHLLRTFSNHMAIEMIASYGMAVGREVFDTCVWIGRFIEAWSRQHGRPSWEQVYRRDVKMHLCGNNAAKDSNIRAALIDRFGPGKAAAKGTKKLPGPLYGIANDEWAALGVAVTAYDKAEK